MIRELENGSLYMDFVRSFADDPVFSDPLLLNEKQVQKNLLETDRSQDKHMYGIFENNQMIGLFVFYVFNNYKIINKPIIVYCMMSLILLVMILL